MIQLLIYLVNLHSYYFTPFITPVFMDYIQIPIPDFSFTEFAKEKADEVCKDELKLNGQYIMLLSINNTDIQRMFNTYLNELATKEEKITYLSVILTHLSTAYVKAKDDYSERDYGYLGDRVKKVKHFFYKQAVSIGYNLDQNAFTDEDVSELKTKIDAILSKLDEVQMGQEIIFDDLTELKSDFESLKADFLLGKKRWYQRLLGVSVSYAGEKGADAILEQLKPLLHDFFINKVPHILDKL